MGVFLACVGVFPVDERFGLHTLVASGMVVVFASLIVRIRALVPSISRDLRRDSGWVFLAAIVVAAVLWFPVGYYNLTAVELIAASLVFSWLIVLIREPRRRRRRPVQCRPVQCEPVRGDPATPPGATARCGARFSHRLEPACFNPTG